MKNINKELVSSRFMRYIYIVIIVLLVSCNRGKENINKSIQKPINVSFKIDLPRTIRVSDTLEGLVLYKSDYSFMKLSKGERRYVYLCLANQKIPSKDYIEFKNIKKDTFGLIYDSIIPIYDIKFNSKGKKYLEGYIIEQIYIMDTTINKIRKSSLETKITHSIMVE